MSTSTRSTKNTRSQATERGIDEDALYLLSPSSGWVGGQGDSEPGRLGHLGSPRRSARYLTRRALLTFQPGDEE